MLCPNIKSPKWHALVDKIGETNAWREFLAHGEIPEASKYEISNGKAIQYSIRTKSTEEIAAGIDQTNIKNAKAIRYSNTIKSGLLTKMGDLTPGIKLKVSPSDAFNQIKKDFVNIKDLLLSIANDITDEQSYNEIVSSPEFTSGELLEEYPAFEYIKSYDDIGKALTMYSDLVENFDKYKDYAIADLSKLGITIVKNKIVKADTKDEKNNQIDDETEDVTISANELGGQFADGKAFQTNPKDTAGEKVKALLHTVKTGQTEFGLPIYASPDDVNDDILHVGSKMQVIKFSSGESKINSFITLLAERAKTRPYLEDLLNKIATYQKNNDTTTLNQIVAYATKAYANENILVYKSQKSGNEITSLTNIKIFGNNRDSVEQQVSKDWVANHLSSSTNFYITNSLNERLPNPEKVNELKTIIDKSKDVTADKKELFKNFFSVLGIHFTDDDMKVIYDNLAKSIKKGKTFDGLFNRNNLLDNIYKSYNDNLTTVYEGQYGFQDQSGDMNKLAKIYYDANPKKYNVVSAKTADNKNKYLYIETSHVENIKRNWETDKENQVKTHRVFNSAFAAPNLKFWENAQKGISKFKLEYFNGSKDEASNRDGKVRKDFAPKDQTVTMFLNHQTANTYISFTLSDKSSSLQTTIDKEFFNNASKIEGAVMGKSIDFTISNKTGAAVYTAGFKNKLYNNFAEPEISRIQASIKAGNKVNVEDFQTASKLFYIVPSLNIDERLEEFRKDLYDGKDISKYKELIGQVILDDMLKSTDKQIDTLLEDDVMKKEKDGRYRFHLFNPTYVNEFRKTGLLNRNLAQAMVMDLKTNYMNAQVKNLQFFGFDPTNAFKRYSKGFTETDINKFSNEDKLKCVNATWDEFSKRAAGLIAPGSQGTWTWNDANGKPYSSETYKAVTLKDVKIGNSETTDAQEFTTVQEHIDFLMSEGDIPIKVWQSIHDKIEAVKDTDHKYYELTDEEMDYLISPIKPVQFSDVTEVENLNRIDYVKSSRFPLVPQNEMNSERNKLRLWMENNGIQAVNFASAKKLGRPVESIQVFDKNNVFTEPDLTGKENTYYQTLTRDGLRKQQVVPDQKDHITTVSQMNRTLLDGLLQSDGFKLKDLTLKGAELKKYKEAVRSKLFEIATEKFNDKVGDLDKSHAGLRDLLVDVIKSDTTGSYTSNDLKALELSKDGKFKIPLEAQFKFSKFQSLINSLINKNVMLKVTGSSFIQVSGVGAKYSFSDASARLKSGIIWLDKYVKDGEETTLKYLRKEGGKVVGAQVIVSQYLKDDKGNLIDLSQFIITDENGRKILDTSSFDDNMFQMVASRIPNQSHPSMLPIEVVGFLPSNMQNAIIVPDGITGQMGSDFDVDKLFTYLSNTVLQKDEDGKISRVRSTHYDLKSMEDINKMDEEQLLQLYKDIHWSALTHADAYDKITSSVDLPEVKGIISERNKSLEKYGINKDAGSSLPLDFNTSINRFNDNRSAKDGVAIFANYISAQADFQDRVITLGSTDERGEVKIDGIKVRLYKGSPITELLYIGQQGKSESLTKDSDGKKLPLRTISDVINMMMTESVDNVKNQNLKEFNWDKKSMSAIGVFSMLTNDKGEAPSVEFSANLTSQASIYQYFNKLDKKQDSFGEYDSEAKANAFLETQQEIIDVIRKHDLVDPSVVIEDHLNNEFRDKTIYPEILKDMWVVGMAIKDGKYIEYQNAAKAGKPTTDTTLMKIATDLKYKSVKDMLLKYYETQYDSLELFNRLDEIGIEFNTILGSIYTYTKGIGSDIFTTKQKINQLLKLTTSNNFLNLNRVAGEITKDLNGVVSMSPVGEIGNAINNSLIKAQEVYMKLFPMSIGQTIDGISERLFGTTGVINIDDVSKRKFVTTYNDALRGIKNYLFTTRGLELFANAIEERKKLINGPTSIGARVAAIKQGTDKDLASNGFLKNIEIKTQMKGGNAYILNFKSPFGGEIDENIVTAGFYDLVNHPKEEIRQLAKDLAIYPFATGDAGNIGRFIPVEYYMSDSDFNQAMTNLNSTYSSELSIDNPYTLENLVQQIVQNNPDMYSKKFKFSTTIEEGARDSIFKKVMKQEGILGNKVEDLSKVPSFKINIGNVEAYAKNDPKATSIVNALKVPLSNLDKKQLGELAQMNAITYKYPDYIMITDSLYDSQYDERSRETNYLYKRTTRLGDPKQGARYERIPILGYGNIKEFDFKNEMLFSAIKENNVDGVEKQLTDGVIPEVEKQMEQPSITPTQQSSTQLSIKSMSELTNHSGGAYGADTFWDIIGREFGVTKHMHYREASNASLSKKLRDANVTAITITPQQLEEGYKELEKVTRKTYERNLENNLKARNFFQVKNADAIYAIAQLNIDKEFDATSVFGGTNAAIQMAIAIGKPTYVWNTTDKTWYKWNNNKFEKTETPILTKNFAGIGTRDIENYSVKNKEGKWVPRESYKGAEIEQAAQQAIRDVYQKTKDSITSQVTPVSEITKEKYTRAKVTNDPNTAYVFTENTHSITAFPNRVGGGSAIIRGLDNAYAIVTKQKYDYNTKENVDYNDTDKNFEEFKKINTELIDKLKNSGKNKIVFPEGFANDKATMPTRFAEWLKKALLDNFGLVTELNSTKTGLISKSIVKKQETSIQQELSFDIPSQEENFRTHITTVEYGGKQFIVESEGPYSGDIPLIYYMKNGEKGELVKDPHLNYKVSIKHDTILHPQDVVTIKIGGKENSYFIDMEGTVVSLQESSYGTTITSDDIYNRVMKEHNKPLVDKKVEEIQEQKLEKQPEGEKPKFEYKGTSVTTEFPLSKEQTKALENLIDFVEEKAQGEGQYYGTHTLEGYAGTGKTSIIGVLDKYIKAKNKGTQFIYMAPTHAATVALGLNVVKYGSTHLPMTVQSAVREGKNPKTNVFEINFTKKFNDRATGIKNVIILDEASMLANKDFDKLVAASQAQGHRVIFLGDPKQIPEVTTNTDKKDLAKAFNNPNKSLLSEVFRTKDNNILTVLTNIRNANEYNEQSFTSTDNLKQVTRSDYNDELINDLQNNLEDTIVINYTNEGVAKINQNARQVLGFNGELQVGEKVIGYLGSQTKQIEKGHLANSVSYVINNIKKTNEGPVIITAHSKLLSNLIDQGMTGFRDKCVFTYLQLSNVDSLNFNLASEQLENNKKILKEKLEKIHNYNVMYANRRIGYVDYVGNVNAIRLELADINTGAKYIYNPNTGNVELYNSTTHKGINQNLELDKGIDFGYGITIHKSQGMTIPNVYFDTSSIAGVKKIAIMRDGKQFNTEQNALYYVGMSRASNKLVVPVRENARVYQGNINEYEESSSFDVPESPANLIDMSHSEFLTQMTINQIFGDDVNNIMVRDVLNSIKENASPFNKEVINAIIKSKPTPFKIVVDYKTENPGMYNPNTKIVTINPKLAFGEATEMRQKIENLHSTILHEILHHITSDLLNADVLTLSAEQRKYVMAIKNLFNDAQKQILNSDEHKEGLKNAIEQANRDGGYLSEKDKSKYYGLTSVHDFVSMMMSDAAFRNFMNQTKFSGQKSIITRFLDILANLLGIYNGKVREDSVLHEGLSNIVGLMGTTGEAQIQKSIATAPSFNETVLRDNFNDVIKLLDIKTKC